MTQLRRARRPIREERMGDMKYTVYEVFPDGKRFFRYESNDSFDCEVYVENHKYSYSVSGKLIIEEE